MKITIQRSDTPASYTFICKGSHPIDGAFAVEKFNALYGIKFKPRPGPKPMPTQSAIDALLSSDPEMPSEEICQELARRRIPAYAHMRSAVSKRRPFARAARAKLTGNK